MEKKDKIEGGLANFQRYSSKIAGYHFYSMEMVRAVKLW
jgi:hypothetical protein